MASKTKTLTEMGDRLNLPVSSHNPILGPVFGVYKKFEVQREIVGHGLGRPFLRVALKGLLL